MEYFHGVWYFLGSFSPDSTTVRMLIRNIICPTLGWLISQLDSSCSSLNWCQSSACNWVQRNECKRKTILYQSLPGLPDLHQINLPSYLWQPLLGPLDLVSAVRVSCWRAYCGGRAYCSRCRYTCGHCSYTEAPCWLACGWRYQLRMFQPNSHVTLPLGVSFRCLQWAGASSCLSALTSCHHVRSPDT